MRTTRAERKAAKEEAARAAAAAEPKYEIVDARTGSVLQEVSGTGRAQRAQEDWHGLWLSDGGPRTILRARPTGLPDIRKTLDALIMAKIPNGSRNDYRHVLGLIITQRVPLEDLQ